MSAVREALASIPERHRGISHDSHAPLASMLAEISENIVAYWLLARAMGIPENDARAQIDTAVSFGLESCN